MCSTCTCVGQQLVSKCGIHEAVQWKSPTLALPSNRPDIVSTIAIVATVAIVVTLAVATGAIAATIAIVQHLVP